MNRLHHLNKTLPENIKDNLKYPYVEHILLDYNSQDGLENWVKDNLSPFIENKRLKYYRTYEPSTFNMAHSRNMVSRLAEGDIIALVDADNFTGNGFAGYINGCFKKSENIFLTAINRRIVKNAQDVLGRLAFKKNDFMNIGGFDERMVSYGFEDYDLANRLQLSGLRRKLISPKYLTAISHSKEERIVNMEVNRNFERLFIRHILPYKSEVLFLFKDKSFGLGTIVNNYGRQLLNIQFLIRPRTIKYSDKLSTEDWKKGQWIEEANRLKLSFSEPQLSIDLELSPNRRYLLSADNKRFFLARNQSLISDLILFYSVIANRNKMESNLKLRRTMLNNGRFGTGRVFRNFQMNAINL